MAKYKRYYTTSDRTGEEIEVSLYRANLLRGSGAKKDEDFEIEDSDEPPPPEVLADTAKAAPLSETEIGRSPLAAPKAKTPTAIRKKLTRAAPVPKLSDLDRRKAAMYDYLKNHSPEKFDALTLEQKQLHARATEKQKAENLDRDLAEFNKKKEGEILPSNFENFLSDKYAAATKKEKPGVLLRAGRVLNDLVSGRPTEVGGQGTATGAFHTPWGQLAGWLRGALSERGTIPNAMDELRGRYDVLTAPKTESPSLGETWEYAKAHPVDMLGEMAYGLTDPQELPTNIAAMAVSGGIGAAAKTGAGAVKATTALGRLAQDARRTALFAGGIPAGIAADATIGGLQGAYQSGEFNGGDFSFGAVPGAVMGGLGASGGYLLSRKPKAHVDAGPSINESWLKHSENAHYSSGSDAPFVPSAVPASYILDTKLGIGNGKRSPKSPKVQQELLDVGQQIKADPEMRARIAPNASDDLLDTHEGVLAVLEGAKKREANAVPPPAVEPAPIAPKKVEDLRQALPTTPENEVAWFSEGTAKQQADKLRKAHRAYRELRSAGLIEENPRFEGKTEADLLAEHLAAQKEGDSPVARGLRDELAKTQRHDVIKSKLESAYDRQRYMGATGEMRKAFSELSPDEQRHFIDRADEMGDVGAALRQELGAAYEPLKRVSSNTSLDDVEFGKEVNAWLDADKNSMAKTENVQQTQMDAALEQQADLDQIYEAAGVEKPALGKVEKPVVADTEAHGQLSADEKFQDKAQQYAVADDELKVEALQDELKRRPELAGEMGITAEELRAANGENAAFAKRAKATIDAKIAQFAKDNPELPESFR